MVGVFFVLVVVLFIVFGFVDVVIEVLLGILIVNF